ncbi:MAG: hypothetical protein IIZ78_00340 [Clostridiales bacterium]|nr:hypothetical protein [Clostridiales bacterium]
MKLLIAIPTYDYMHFQFVECLTKLIMRLDADGINYDVVYKGGTLVYVGRDKLAKLAIEKGYSHVLWLDSDMIFNEDLLDNLMESGKDFVTGIAHGRRSPHCSCLFKSIWPMVDRWEGHDYPHSAFKVGGCGFACVLIKTDIIRHVYETHGTAFYPMRELGEDLAFCKRAVELNHEIWAEPKVWLGHIGHITVYPDYEDLYMGSIQTR